jgi:hypothetical protein
MSYRTTLTLHEWCLTLHAFRRSRIATVAASFGLDLGEKILQIVCVCLGIAIALPATRMSLSSLVGVDETETWDDSPPISGIPRKSASPDS